VYNNGSVGGLSAKSEAKDWKSRSSTSNIKDLFV
jgi:hypothetical protein